MYIYVVYSFKMHRMRKSTFHPLSNVHGIGSVATIELNKLGIKTIGELRSYSDKNPDVLTHSQKLGLKWHTDIIRPIPRTEVIQHAKYIHANAKLSNHAMIAGSFRRGSPVMGDIDIITITPISVVIEKLKKYIIGTLSVGETSWKGIVRLPGGGIARRLDILYTPPNQYWFAVLYFTGSKVFNIKMRAHAKRMGYRLDQRGLVDIKTGAKITDGRSEKSIFVALKMKYIPPNTR